MNTATSIAPDARRKIATDLGHLLADTYTLYLKTQNFHWNVTGPMFSSLHLLFEQEYTELALAVDIIAERIRALGEFAPGSFSRYTELSRIKEEQGIPAAMEMVKQLAQDQETITATARSIIADVEQAHDEATLDLLTQRINTHEKNAWMLRSHLE